MKTGGVFCVVANRFPVKHAWDALSLARVVFFRGVFDEQLASFEQRLNQLKFYFHTDGVRRLYASFPRSGSHWSELGMTLAIDLAGGGNGEYSYDDREFWPRDGVIVRRLDWRVPLGRENGMYVRVRGPALAEPVWFQTRNPYFRVRSAQLKNMKIVLLTRSIVDSLASRYLKFTKIRARDRFDLDKNLGRAISFFNSWGDVLTWHNNIRHYKYEDLTADPVSSHKEILDFWGLDIPEYCVAEAFRKVTEEEMKIRVAVNERDQSFRLPDNADDYRQVFSPAELRHIGQRLDRELIFTLGHDHTSWFKKLEV